jgi:hypothetical protein
MKLNFFNIPFPYHDSFRNRLVHVAIILGFSMVFMEVFEPFNINVWMQFEGWLSWVGLAGFGILGTVIIAISQLLVRSFVPFDLFRVRHFVFWVAAELLCVTVFLTLFYGSSQSLFFTEGLSTLKYVALVLVLPYSFSILIIALVWHRKENSRENLTSVKRLDLIPFRDERGQLKFSINHTDILFLESTDNYITVHFFSEGIVRKEMVRSSLKRLEASNITNGMVRCHRSYIVNLENVLWMKKENRNYVLKLKFIDILIPVSNSYIPNLKSFIQV